MLRGCDVSAFQGDVDWSKARDALELSFVLIKTAEGMGSIPDSKSRQNVAGATAAGLAVAPYFFLRPAIDVDAGAQARLHHSLAVSIGLGGIGDLPPCMDLEAPMKWTAAGFTPTTLRQWALDYADALQELSGVTPILYSYPDFLMRLGVVSEPRFKAYPLWMASYNIPTWPSVGDRPLILKPWTDWLFWQRDGGSRVTLPNGSKTDVDVFNGDGAALEELKRKEGLGAILPPDA